MVSASSSGKISSGHSLRLASPKTARSHAEHKSLTAHAFVYLPYVCNCLPSLTRLENWNTFPDQAQGNFAGKVLIFRTISPSTNLEGNLMVKNAFRKADYSRNDNRLQRVHTNSCSLSLFCSTPLHRPHVILASVIGRICCKIFYHLPPPMRHTASNIARVDGL